MQKPIKGIDRLLAQLQQLVHHDEYPENPGFDLSAALPFLNLSDGARRLVEDIIRLAAEECFGESNNVIWSQLDYLRQYGFPCDLGYDHEGLGRLSLVIYTTKGAIEV